MKPLLALVLLVLFPPGANAQENFRSSREAFAAGAKLFGMRQFAASQPPLEMALQLGPDPKLALDLHEMLFSVYRETAQAEKAVAAAEFVIRNHPRKAGRSISTSRLAGYLQAQGNVDDQVARYEAMLKKTPDDLAALGVLEQIYARGLRKQPDRQATLSAKRTEIEVGLAKKLAGELEAEARANPSTAAQLLKDAAQVWLEAADTASALAAAKKSLAALPEARSSILTYQWQTGLGDVFAACGDKTLASQAYQAALALQLPEALKKPVQAKLDALGGEKK
jgi:predicted negative regulator of RcsB-dependent stress response